MLTAFEPFDESGLNSSLEACQEFLSRAAADFDLRFEVLPVRYGADTCIVDRALRDDPADVVLHTGQASGAREVRVERIAVNVRYPGDVRARDGHRPIDPELPAAVFASLPVEEVVEAITAAGIPAAASNHAGIYLCNHVLYRSVLRAAELRPAPRVGFLHIPGLPEQCADASLTADQSATAIHAALTCLQTNPTRGPFLPSS